MLRNFLFFVTPVIINNALIYIPEISIIKKRIYRRTLYYYYEVMRKYFYNIIIKFIIAFL